MRTAPVLVTVWTSERAYLDRYAEPDKGWTDRDKARWSAPYWWVDAGMAAMNVLLAAWTPDSVPASSESRQTGATRSASTSACRATSSVSG